MTAAEIENYRTKRDEFIALADRADAAFLRHFAKLQNGEPTNAAQATRLSHLANYASADLSTAAGPLWAADLDPAEIDRQDGVDLGFVP